MTAATAVAAAGCVTASASARRPAPEAIVYRNDKSDAGCPAYDGAPGCAEAIAQVLRKSPHRFRVTFVGPARVKGNQDLHKALLRKPALYVQPGGGDHLDRAWSEMRKYARDIRAYVRNGGRYLGLCMGAYLAGTVDEDGTGLEILPGDAGQYTALPGAKVTDDAKDTATEVDWSGFGRRVVFFQGGPYFQITDPSAATVLARYEMKGNQPRPVAAMVARYGRGKVAVSGPHPEAPAGWWRDSDRPGDQPANLNIDLAFDLLSALLG